MLDALTSNVDALTGGVLKIVEVQTRQQDMIANLIAAMNQLADDQRQTQVNLNALIQVVDELVRRNGGRPKA